MLWDQLFEWMRQAADWFLSLLPDFYLDCSGMGALAGIIAVVGGYIDVGSWATVLGIIIGFEVAVWGVQAALWLYRLLPFKGT
jgi:hypothetical protein